MENAWILRPSPHNIDRLVEFREQKIIALGWPALSTLSQSDYDSIKQLLSEGEYAYKGIQLGTNAATLDILVNRMQEGDLVIVPQKEDIYFCIIESPYVYDVNRKEDGYPHQRRVKWLSQTKRDMLPSELRNSLKAPRTAVNVSKYYEIVHSLAYGGDIGGTVFTSADYRLRPNVMVKISVPNDMTKDEAERLSSYIKTVYFQ